MEDKEKNSDISSESFSKLGEDIYQTSNTYTYYHLNKKFLLKKLENIEIKLVFITKEIAELNIVLQNLLSRCSNIRLNKTFSVNMLIYSKINEKGRLLNNIKKQIEITKLQLKQKESEKNTILLEIQEISSEINKINKIMSQY
jgi:phosphoenolpyruvate synthase/pyruvate phosphate dikinase